MLRNKVFSAAGKVFLLRFLVAVEKVYFCCGKRFVLLRERIFCCDFVLLRKLILFAAIKVKFAAIEVLSAAIFAVFAAALNTCLNFYSHHASRILLLLMAAIRRKNPRAISNI